MIYQLTGAADRIQQVIRHFYLRVDAEHSSTMIDVEVEEDESDDVELFAESVGVSWKEL